MTVPPSDERRSDVSHLLLAWGQGDVAARKRLISLVYNELYRIAQRQMRRERRITLSRPAHWLTKPTCGSSISVDTEWLPLLTAPNQPEYAGAHGSIMSAVAEVLTEFFGTDRINVDIHRLDSADALHAVRHFETASQLRQGDHQCQAMGRTAF